MISYDTVIGNVTVTESYLTKLIGNEVTSCFGVVGMMPGNNRQRITHLLTKNESEDTGITVSGDENNMNVEIHIVVTYGMNISAIAESITEKVKFAVKEATDIDINRVVVKVDGIKE